jgi:hypothetical protein
MKSIIIIFMIAVGYLVAEPAKVQTKLDSVKVYLQGAELSHSAKVKLEKGKTTLKLDGISRNLLENSIRINTEKEIEIMSVTLKSEPKMLEKTQAILATEDSIDKIEYKIEELNNERTALNEELEMVKANKNIGGNSGTTVQQIKDMADFFRTRILDIKSKIQKINIEHMSLNEKNNKLKVNLTKLTSKNTGTNSFIELVINSETEMSTGLVLSYYTSQASWYPEYNVKVKGITSKPDIYYKARVRQNSGIDWEDIDITLSTGNPMLSLNKPVLTTIFAAIQASADRKPLSADGVNNIVSLSSGNSQSGTGWSVRGARQSETQIRVDGYDVSNSFTGGFGNGENDKLNSPDELINEYQNIEGNFESITGNITFEYKPLLKYTIMNDNQYYSVNMQKKEMESDYQYYCAPSKNSEVFLIAGIKNWEELNLLPGSANIYYENSYNGRTYINPTTTDSILQITVAVDKEIIVKRTQMKEYREGKFLSSKNEKTYGYTITIRNTKDKAIKMIVEDQVPVSDDEDIEIEVSEKSGANHNTKTGIIKWTVELKPGEKIEKQLVYSLTAPGNRPLQIN